MGEARDAGWSLLVHHGLLAVPCRVEGMGSDKEIHFAGTYAELWDVPPTDALLEQVWAGHEDWPGLALLLDERAGLCAIDADSDEAVEWVQKRVGARTPTFRSSRGLKWLFRLAGQDVRSSDGLIHEHVDLKAPRAALVVPPTPGYTWLPSLSLDDVAAVPLPPKLRAQAAKARKPRAAKDAGPIPEGERNGRLTSLAGQMRRTGASEEELLFALRAFYEIRCEHKPVISDVELKKIANSIGKYPPKDATEADEQSVRDRRSVLEISDVVEVFRRVRAAGPPTWLVHGLWPADAYGVLGAEDKAGKTWTVLDLAVSIATGTPWLGHFECSPGPVLAFLGEGGERNVVRRLRAILASRGLTDETLEGMLRLCFRVPRLTDREHLDRVRAEVKEHPLAAMTLDPLYLAAPGGKGSDLYAMGEALGTIQSVCQDAGSALAVMTHWNKTGTGSGAQRFTGVGPGAWGRVLGSAEVERRTVDEDGTSDVLLRWEFTGGEIADVTFRCRRRVRAEDPDDLDSPLTYSVEVTGAPRDETDDGLSRPQRRVFAVLAGPDRPLGVREIGDRLAKDDQGPPLRRDTIQKALGALLDRGLVDADKPGKGMPNGWWRT